MKPRKDARNNALIAAYREGASLSAVALQFGMSKSNAYRILELYDATPSWAESLVRITAANRRRAA